MRLVPATPGRAVGAPARGAVRTVSARALPFSLPFVGGTSAAEREKRKQELLDAIKPLARGAAANDEQKAEVARLFKALEAANPTAKPLASDKLSGRWKLLYTTSPSILGLGRPALLRPAGPIYQYIDAANLKAKNQEPAPFFNSVTAELTPETPSRVAVQFKQFKLLGLVPVTAPPSARGKLDVTYLDDDLRLSRGDKGNLFVLAMDDRDARP